MSAEVVGDDAETIRSILEYKLSSESFTIHPHEDGEAARRFLDRPEVDPDVAVLDVMMPRLNGMQLLRSPGQ